MPTGGRRLGSWCAPALQEPRTAPQELQQEPSGAERCGLGPIGDDVSTSWRGSGCLVGAMTSFSHELCGLPGKALVEGMLLAGVEPGPGVSLILAFSALQTDEETTGLAW